MFVRAIDPDVAGVRLAEIYAAAAVEEYWVIDIPRRTIHVHDEPAPTGYGRHRAVTGGSLRPRVAGAPAIDVEALFAISTDVGRRAGVRSTASDDEQQRRRYRVHGPPCRAAQLREGLAQRPARQALGFIGLCGVLNPGESSWQFRKRSKTMSGRSFLVAFAVAACLGIYYVGKAAWPRSTAAETPPVRGRTTKAPLDRLGFPPAPARART